MDCYNFSTQYKVRTADLDYTGRASQAAVLEIFQEARIEYLAQLGNYSEKDIGEGRGIIQSEANVFFLNEIHQGDDLSVAVKITELRGASFVMSYMIHKGSEKMAEGNTTLLALDYSSRKPRRLPAAFKQAITDFEANQS
jgi:YbgC/YbaW family acyl-CoA thioester hydrolase